MDDRSDMMVLDDAVSYSISPENPKGEKGKGAMATEGFGAGAARELGKGWKIHPCELIKPGETLTLADMDGSGMIESMWFGGVVDKNYILRIYWDESAEPSVECPLPDFFAYGWAETQDDQWMKGPFFTLNSSQVVVGPIRGLNCFWKMPFRRHCRMTIENRTERGYMCFYQINYIRTSLPENIGYFHAQYRQSKPLRQGEVHTVLNGVQGKGKYVGLAMSIGLNGDGRWWGEGELKIYLDKDQEAPSIVYTGTEDYFGGSFNFEVDGAYTTYSTPYLGMHYYRKPDGLYNIQPRFSMYRWHVQDAIRFQSDIRIEIQDLGWTRKDLYLARRDDLFTVCYWYQTLGGTSFPKLPDSRELRIVSE
ncbi:glycoside hydrolase family 172 protein [Diplocloster modestus]|uniref:DUF2961 domain-containing protein n=1 Tax=Diplocloster modestus TaxID=2850322 RepID=A0ABS6K934_9FIRM|nr:glycoside hydrolase family 172 protein [Diplocloster modestus]MBU9727017.1 DUF2961 domain-containing protein [Diplocloster modestus]